MAQIWYFWPQIGHFGAISTPLGAFFWRVLHLGWSSHMCITVIHHLIHFCQPSGASGASYGQKMAILGPNGPLWSHFHTTECAFLTSFAPRLVLLHVFNCDPPFDPLLPAIWGVWSLLWPKTAVLAKKRAFFGHNSTKSGKIGVLKVDLQSTQYIWQVLLQKFLPFVTFF